MPDDEDDEDEDDEGVDGRRASAVPVDVRRVDAPLLLSKWENRIAWTEEQGKALAQPTNILGQSIVIVRDQKEGGSHLSGFSHIVLT